MKSALTIGLIILLAACLAVLESRFRGLNVEHTVIADTPVTLYSPAAGSPVSPVILAHGFAGSRQMMDQIAVSAARQGFLVASIDLPGHGRNGAKLSADVTNIDGTTAQLVDVVKNVAEAVAARSDTVGPVSYVGHSMATDILIRASKARDDVGGVVAISMYSPEVTESHPQALLVVSGATEGHLRKAALDAARMLDPEAREGQTVTEGGVIRRTAVAPYVGHVGVLYAGTSLEEITSWLRGASGAGQTAALDRTGWVAGLFLVGLVLLSLPLSKLLPKQTDTIRQPIPRRTFVLCLLAPIPAALLVAALPVFGVAGYAAFGTLAAIFAAWGLIQISILHQAGIGIAKPEAVGTVVYLGMSMIFALALDRYGAAFLPTGDRAWIAAVLFVGTLPLMVADTMLVDTASFWRRVLTRFALLVGLAAAIALKPTELGLAFTILPVLILFFCVYGTIARWVAARRGPGGVAIGKALVMAWSVAASTPLFMAAALP